MSAVISSTPAAPPPAPAAPAADPAPPPAPKGRAPKAKAKPAPEWVVLSNGLGPWLRGDRVTTDELQTDDLDRLLNLKAIEPITPAS